MPPLPLSHARRALQAAPGRPEPCKCRRAPLPLPLPICPSPPAPAHTHTCTPTAVILFATLADCASQRLPPGRAARPPASFLPIAPRPASSSPSAAAPVAAAAAGPRRDSQQGAGADRNRPVDPLMSAYPGPSVQGYGHAHGHGHTPGHGYSGVSRGHTHAGYSAVSHGVYPPSTLDPAQLALGASAGAYAATVPVSLPMAGGERDMFFEGGFVDDAAALEGLDLDEVLREDWSWLDSGAGAGAGPAPL